MLACSAPPDQAEKGGGIAIISNHNLGEDPVPARALVLLVFLAACATSEPDSVTMPPTRPASVIVSGSTVEVNLPPHREIVTEAIQATPEVAWASLHKAYEDLGIEVKEANERLRILVNPRFVVSRRLAGTPLSRYLECGRGLLGHFADTYRIEMHIRSSVVPGEAGVVQVNTYLEAVARNPEGTSGTAISCSSTQRLEREIAARVRYHAEGG
jgi:hypothetical protein